MGVDATLGVKSASEFIFFILTLPSGGYFKGAGDGPGAIDVLVSTSVVRTAPGLMGSVKAGANYAGTLTITEHAKAVGCSQVLFLDSHDHQYIEEMGGMNIMFVQGNLLRTPPLTDTILRGVTRDSLLVLAKDQGLDVSEEPITIDEVVAGVKDGSIAEMFACGTAAVVIGIRSLQFEDGSSVRTSGCPGPVTRRLYEALTGVQYGRVPDRTGGSAKSVLRTPGRLSTWQPAHSHLGDACALITARRRLRRPRACTGFLRPRWTRATRPSPCRARKSEHLTRVLRLTAGDTVAVFDGRGHEFLARVIGAAVGPDRRREIAVQLLSRVEPAAEPSVALTLVQAVLKADKMDDIVRDAVMLGAAAIHPIISHRTEATVARR